MIPCWFQEVRQEFARTRLFRSVVRRLEWKFSRRALWYFTLRLTSISISWHHRLLPTQYLRQHFSPSGVVLETILLYFLLILWLSFFKDRYPLLIKWTCQLSDAHCNFSCDSAVLSLSWRSDTQLKLKVLKASSNSTLSVHLSFNHILAFDKAVKKTWLNTVFVSLKCWFQRGMFKFLFLCFSFLP